MRRTVCLLAAVLLALPSRGSDAPRGYDGAAEIDGIEGTWELTGIQVRANVIGSSGLVTTYRGGTFTSHSAGGGTVSGIYHLDPARKPSYLDTRPSSGAARGKNLKFIYEVKGDTLRLAYPSDPDDFRRPQAFGGEEVTVLVYKRVK
jgi:uncharacterized protein (TIGR03067 family)